MQGSKPRADPVAKGRSSGGKYVTLFIWVVGVCLSFGAYTFLVNALVPGAAGETPAVLHSLAAPSQEAVMRIDPATQTVDPGATFSVTVMIQDVMNLGAFEFELTYDPTYINIVSPCADAVTLGPFLGSTGRGTGEVGPVCGTGSVSFGAYSWSPPDNGPDGDGVLATITFQAMSVGTSALHLQDVLATEADATPISTTTSDGEVRVGTPLPPNVTRITPNSGYAGRVLEDVIVEGEHFQVGASVQLTKSGQRSISAPMPNVQSSTRISCTFNLQNAATGLWNVVVTNPDAQSATLPNGFSVMEALPPPTITSITPNSGNNNGVVHVTNLAGSNFQTGATVKLTRAGQPDIIATNVVRVSGSKITCDFDLRGASPGQRTVRVTNPDTQYAERANGFTVKEVVYLPIVLKNH